MFAQVFILALAASPLVAAHGKIAVIVSFFLSSHLPGLQLLIPILDW